MRITSAPDPGDKENWAMRGFRKGFTAGGGSPHAASNIFEATTRAAEAAAVRVLETYIETKLGLPATGRPEKRPSLPLWLTVVTKICLLLGYLAGRSIRPLLSPGSLTRLAVFLAGRKRADLADEWRAHLAGSPGGGLSRRDQIRAARGFVWASLRYRLEDVADLAWRPADAVLGSRTLSNLFVGGPVIVVLFAIVHHDGRFGLVTDIQDAGELGAFLYGVIRVGRWWRAVKLPEPKPRRAKE